MRKNNKKRKQKKKKYERNVQQTSALIIIKHKTFLEQQRFYKNSEDVRIQERSASAARGGYIANIFMQTHCRHVIANR